MTDKIQLNRFIDRWIIDYRCRELWNTFEKTGFVSSDSCNLAYFTLNLPNNESCSTSGDDTYPRSVLLIDLMCKLSNGRTALKQSARKNRTTTSLGLTILEEAIEALNRLVKETDLNNFVSNADIASLKQAIKRQAVYVLCRQGNFKLASVVFDRQFEQWTGDADAKNEVSRVLLTKIIDHPKLTTESYDTLINEGRAFLRKIIGRLSIPFLTSVAQNVCESLQKPTKNKKSVTKDNITEILRGTSLLPNSSIALQPQKSETLTVHENRAKPIMLFPKSNSADTTPPLPLLAKTDQNVPIVVAKKSQRKKGTATCKYIVQGRNIVDTGNVSSLTNVSVDGNNAKPLEISQGTVISDVRPLMLFSHADLTTNKAVDLLKANPTISINKLALSKLKSDKSKVKGISRIASKRSAKPNVVLSSSINLMNKGPQLKKRKFKDSGNVSNRPWEVAAASSFDSESHTTDSQSVQSPEASKRLKKLPKRFEDGYIME